MRLSLSGGVLGGGQPAEMERNKSENGGGVKEEENYVEEMEI